MKKLLLFTCLLFILSLAFSVGTNAEALAIFEEDIGRITDQAEEATGDRLDQLGVGELDTDGIGELSLDGIFSILSDEVSNHIAAPLTSFGLIMTALVLYAALDSYTSSLRYADTHEVMGIVTSLFIVTAVIVPVGSLIETMSNSVSAAGGIMTVYLPVMAGILAFSGRSISGGGYYAAATLASQGIVWLNSNVIVPMLYILITLSACAGISVRIRLRGLCDAVYRLMKWLLVFGMSIYSTVLGLNAAIAKAGDTVSDRAVRFALTSFIPVIGASISEAYRSIRDSVNVLRSGLGVYIIIAVMVMFLPVIIKSVLWLMAIQLSRTVSEMLYLDTPVAILGSLSSVVSLVIAVCVSVMAAFSISSGVIMSIGGAS